MEEERPNQLLRVDDLGVAVRNHQGRVAEVVRGVSFAVARAETVALVGESGCGKSLTAFGILDLLPMGATRSRGDITVAGSEGLAAAAWRGRRVALVPQEAQSGLNPVISLGGHLVETLRVVRGLDRRQARREARRLLERVAMPDAGNRLGAYAHELSGGQRQRAMIALALAGDPLLLLADEPTTALDVTLQAQILDLLAELRRDLGLAILLITHDLAVVAAFADRTLVMYAGEIVEQGPVAAIFSQPAHPYTAALLASRLQLGARVPPRGIPGRVAEAAALPVGCPFAARCAWALPKCFETPAPMATMSEDRSSRCHRSDEVVVAEGGMP